MPFFEIQITAPVELHDPVTNRLFELGAQGVNEPDPKSPQILRGFFDTESRAIVEKELPVYLQSLTEIFPGLPKAAFVFLEVPDENWSESFKKYYLPQALSSVFFLRPAWEPPSVVPPGYVEIVMEPGQAFGTGLHPTTRLCVRIIERGLSYFKNNSEVHLLDVGTGTGILAIVAAKLDVGHVVGIDNDPIAVEVASENMQLNHCSKVEISGTDLAKVKGPFHILVSNILFETHKELADQYVRLVPEGGYLILSGLLTPQAKEMDAMFRELGFVFDCSVSLQEWTALAYTKCSPKS